MENNENIPMELEEMRDQIAILKKKLNHEQIVNDQLLRETMSHKATSINRNAWISIAASLFVIIWAIFFLPSQGFSWWFIGTTILMMLICDFFTWKYHKNLNKKTMNGDLVTVAKVMKQLRKNYHNWIKYGITMVVIWIAWMIVEYCIILKDWLQIAIIVVSLLIGGLIGGFLGMRMNRNVMNNADDIIKQIEEKE